MKNVNHCFTFASIGFKGFADDCFSLGYPVNRNKKADHECKKKADPERKKKRKAQRIARRKNR